MYYISFELGNTRIAHKHENSSGKCEQHRLIIPYLRLSQLTCCNGTVPIFQRVVRQTKIEQ